MLDWLTQHVWWLTGFSALLFVVGLPVAALVVVRMPADYFVVRQKSAAADGRRTTLRVLRRLMKNMLGMLLLVAGVLMSLPLVPGPGLLLILIGVSLTDFPGKRALELRIVRNPLVLRPVNGLRTTCGRQPLQLPPDRRTRGTETESANPVAK